MFYGMSNELQNDREGRTVIVRFTRPEIRNPLSITVLEELHQIVDGCNDASSIERLIFTGTDDVFASGADLREIALVTVESAREFAVRGQTLMTKIESLPQTTIAAINGFCLGGALDLALACDRRIASPNATFAHPGVGLGIITGWGGTQRLPRLIGEAMALEMFLTAKRTDADEASRIGLIDKISVNPLAESLANDFMDTSS